MVLSVSFLVCWCELDDCCERVQTSNFLSATLLSCWESNSHLRSGRDADKTVLSCLAWLCELALTVNQKLKVLQAVAVAVALHELICLCANLTNCMVIFLLCSNTLLQRCLYLVLSTFPWTRTTTIESMDQFCVFWCSSVCLLVSSSSANSRLLRCSVSSSPLLVSTLACSLLILVVVQSKHFIREL